MLHRHRLSALAVTAFILAGCGAVLCNVALAQETTSTPPAIAPAVGAAEAPAPAAPAPSEEAAAVTTPTAISANIITPEVIKDMRERIVQPVTIISINAANKTHTGIDQAAIDKMDAAWKTEAKSDDQPQDPGMAGRPTRL